LFSKPIIIHIPEMPNSLLYILMLVIAFVLSLAFTPIMRRTALHFNILDHPHSNVKTHVEPVPYLGGMAVWVSFAATLFILRFTTSFPTGTLHNLRGFMFGSALVVVVGLVDDLHLRGIHYSIKFAIQFIAASILIAYGIRIQFIHPNYFSVVVSLFWIVGITNAFNLIDVMDGLSSGVAVIAAAAFLLISFPTEKIYVNFAAVILIGSCLGFIPYNLSQKRRIFLGDTGSLFLGFTLSALALGTSYTQINEIGVVAPLLILAIPIYETLLLIYFRLRKRQSPFKGSKDHFSLRMEKLGISRKIILAITLAAGVGFSTIAYFSTRVPNLPALILYLAAFLFLVVVTRWLSGVETE
jgi:UDP-GlcNAc:undecaprenyl-phosphate GlcNAc-1-phosphate transferase